MIAEFSVTPVGAGVHVGRYVAVPGLPPVDLARAVRRERLDRDQVPLLEHVLPLQAVRIVHESGLKYEVNPMGTVVEGPWDDVMAVIKKCNDALLEECERLSIVVKIDSRRGPAPSMQHKVRSVTGRLPRGRT